jgi:hypothetical protein
MFRENDTYTPSRREERKMSDYELMDVLGRSGGRAVDDLLSNGGVAPLDEIRRDPHCKHPASGRCEKDLGLDGADVMQEESAIDDIDGMIEGRFSEEEGIIDADSMVAEAIEEVNLDGF